MPYGTVNADLITTSDGVSSAGLYGLKNRLINGDMRIDQRNAGASVTVNTAGNFYPVDRFACTGQATDGVFTVQQSTTAPSGFKNSILATVTTADASIGATQQYLIQQFIEGFNIADLGWGTASASTVTLSFWVRSSLTGTFGGTLVNAGFNRSYPFTYTISAANTFELKTVTIAGDTTGTWATDNTAGIRLQFSLGAGSTNSGTAGAWAGAYYAGATGQTQIIGTNGATFYLTGVQLEKGSTATSFDYRSYGTELALCQRYLPAFNSTGATQTVGSAYASATTNVNVVMPFMAQPRVVPTGITTITGSGFVYSSTSGITVSTLTFNTGSLQCGTISAALTGATAGSAGIFYASGSGSQILFTGCEL
jgi:hypothetical protein